MEFTWSVLCLPGTWIGGAYSPATRHVPFTRGTSDACTNTCKEHQYPWSPPSILGLSSSEGLLASLGPCLLLLYFGAKVVPQGSPPLPPSCQCIATALPLHFYCLSIALPLHLECTPGAPYLIGILSTSFPTFSPLFTTPCLFTVDWIARISSLPPAVTCLSLSCA